MDEAKKAMQTAEHQLLFSSKLDRIFHSSSPTDFIVAARNSQQAVVFIRSLVKIKDEDLLSNPMVQRPVPVSL